MSQQKQIETYQETFIKQFYAATKGRQIQKLMSMGGKRSYAAASNSRLTSGWAQTNTSADSELGSSLRSLRSRSRALVRDSAYAKRARTIVMNNVVGTGIGLQAQVKNARGKLLKKVNDGIEEAWKAWCRGVNCHTGGTLHFSDIERQLMGQIFEAGEIFVRKHYRKFGLSDVPLALEIIEPERVIDEYLPSPPGGLNNRVRLGVETDEFHRPVAYWIRKLHPGELRVSPMETDSVERVPASDIMHLRIVDRWPQTRGEPWLHAVARKLNDMDGYSEAEVIAARAAASYMGFIKKDPSMQWGTSNANTTEDRELTMEPGVVDELYPGEEFQFVNPNRPNANLDPFMRYMLREVAAGSNVSYESLSRDYSQSNYSSSRLALLDDRDLWQMLQLWFIRVFRGELHREWMNIAAMARAIQGLSVEDFANNVEKYVRAKYKPRGWSWIDPTKEVSAYKEAVKAGFTTVSKVISLTGGGQDIEDVLDEREEELAMMKEKGLAFDTDPAAAPTTNTNEPAPRPDESDNPDDDSQDDDQAEADGGRVIRMRR